MLEIIKAEDSRKIKSSDIKYNYIWDLNANVKIKFQIEIPTKMRAFFNNCTQRDIY